MHQNVHYNYLSDGIISNFMFYFILLSIFFKTVFFKIDSFNYFLKVEKEILKHLSFIK